jgi:glucan 1,3-beta-glucosidase
MIAARSLLLGIAGLLSLAISQSWAATCSGSNAVGTAAAGSPYWLQSVSHQGKAPYNADSAYKVFRNVKDFGAKGKRLHRFWALRRG